MATKHKNIIYILIILVLGFNNIAFCVDTTLYNNINHLPDTLKVNLLNKQAIKFKGASPGKMIEYGKRALILSQKLNYKKGQVQALDNIGNGYSLINNYDKALENYLKSLKIKENIFNEIEIIVTLDNIGDTYENLSKYDKALEYHLKSLKIKENILDEQGVSNSLKSIGVVYYRLNNFEKAIEYYLKSLEISEKFGNKKDISSILNNIGVSYDNLGNYDKALEYHLKSLKIKEEIDDKIGIAYSLNNIGAIYWYSANYDKALEYYLKSLKIKEELGHKKGIAISLFNIGETYLIILNYDKAFFYLEKALILAKETKTKLLIQTIYKTISEYYSSKNDFQKALEYHLLYTEIKDSIYTEKSSKQIAEMQTKYETEKKEKEIEILNKEKQIQNSELKRQRIIVFSIICVLILVLMLVLVIYNRFRLKKKANILLSEQNAEINQQKEEIHTQAEELRKLSIVASETDNAVIIIDEKGEIEWVNEGFNRVFEYNLAEFIELKGSNFFLTSTNPDIEKDINKCKEHKVSVNYISRNRTKSDREIWLQTTLTPILDEQNNIIKYIAIDSDITKLKQIEEEIITRNEHIAIQRNHILKQNNEILASILYASRIQKAILPPDDFLNKIMGEYFVFNKPRDIVSGDFYWASKIFDNIILAVADCTGHGVPGALMSMISFSFLNRIINEKMILEPEEILDQLKKNTINALHQTGHEFEANDGMDIALINLDKKTMKMKFSGAMNPVWFFRNGEFYEIKGDRMSIGYHEDKSRHFMVHEAQMQKGDMIYMFSDGYYDQFGGDEDTRFLKRNFKALLKEIHLLKMPEQKQKLEENYVKWLGKNEQVDDILVMGIRID